jgi:hypothetical protein
MNSIKPKMKTKTVNSNEILECDHCIYVAHCDLKGPQDSVCPHSSTFHENKLNSQEIKLVNQRFKEIKSIYYPNKYPVRKPKQMNNISKLERELELEKVKKREQELEILKFDAEQSFLDAALLLKRCREKRRELE